MTAMLNAHVRVRLGALHLDIDLEAPAGAVVALVGPNGSGKSTLLACLAGARAIDSGRISFDGVVWDDPASRVHVPAERRDVGMVFQDYVLFEHMTVLDNVAFPLRCSGVSTGESRSLARAALADVGLVHAEGLRPRQLSGGQLQRAAFARGLIASPRLLLLDEPFAALDAEARPMLRERLVACAASRVTVIATHDPADVEALATSVVTLKA